MGKGMELLFQAKTAPNQFCPGEKNEPNHRWDQPEKIDTPQRYCQTYQHKTAELSNDKIPASLFFFFLGSEVVAHPGD